MSFYLGIDGGGTKTKFLLGDEQKTLVEATAAGSNALRSGDAAAREALHTGVRAVCASAAIEASRIERTVAGIAGSSNPAVREALMRILREVLGGEIEIVGDMEIAHFAVFNRTPGILVNAGTGSIAFGKNASGEAARAGGWGFAISDEGSGQWIGRVALAAAMRRYDADKEDGYLHHLMAALRVQQPEELAKLGAGDLSQIFPAVVSIAKLGDEAAQLILQHAGEELALLAETVLQRLFADVPEVAVAATGGVFRASETVLQRFSEQLRTRHPEVKVWLSDADPAAGALAMARTTFLGPR